MIPRTVKKFKTPKDTKNDVYVMINLDNLVQLFQDDQDGTAVIKLIEFVCQTPKKGCRCKETRCDNNNCSCKKAEKYCTARCSCRPDCQNQDPAQDKE